MDAKSHLVEIADALADAKLEAILIGNAGAALHGAPVTTLDFDYLYRVARGNEPKLARVAEILGGSLAQPFPGASSVYRIRRSRPLLQVDLTGSIHGVSSFNSLRSRAKRVDLDGRIIVVASLADIIKSKKSANRPQDQAVLYVLETTLEELDREEAQTDQA